MKSLGVFVNNWASWEGGRSYARSLLWCLKEYRESRGAAFESVAVVRKDDDCEWLRADGGLVDRIIVDTADALTPRQMFFERLFAKVFSKSFPRQDIRRAAFCRLNRLDVTFGSTGRIAVPGWFKSAAYIWDLGHRLAPSEFPEKESRQRDKYFHDVCHSNNIVFVSSNHDAAALRELLPSAPAAIKVYSFRSHIPETHLQEDPQDIAASYGIPKKYAIVCNQMWKHKRHDLLVRAIAEIRCRVPDIRVVFTGLEETQYHPEYPASVAALISDLNLNETILRLGSIPRSSQLALLRGSAFVIQPSVSEGWNTGVEEARMLDKKTLMSDIPVHAEQAHEGCLLFQKDNVADLSECLEKMWRWSTPGISTRECIKKAQYRDLRISATELFLRDLGIDRLGRRR